MVSGGGFPGGEVVARRYGVRGQKNGQRRERLGSCKCSFSGFDRKITFARKRPRRRVGGRRGATQRESPSKEVDAALAKEVVSRHRRASNLCLAFLLALDAGRWTLPNRQATTFGTAACRLHTSSIGEHTRKRAFCSVGERPGETTARGNR